MNKRIIVLVFAGMMGMTMLLYSGCCHMNRHNYNKPPCGDRFSGCEKPCCNKAARCDKPPADCPMAEQKK